MITLPKMRVHSATPQNATLALLGKSSARSITGDLPDLDNVYLLCDKPKACVLRYVVKEVQETLHQAAGHP